MTLRLGVNERRRFFRRLDVDNEPIRIETSCRPRAAAQKRLGARRVGRQANHDAAGRFHLPSRTRGLTLGRTLEALRNLAQGELAEGLQVVVLEKMLERPGNF